MAQCMGSSANAKYATQSYGSTAAQDVKTRKEPTKLLSRGRLPLASWSYPARPGYATLDKLLRVVTKTFEHSLHVHPKYKSWGLRSSFAGWSRRQGQLIISQRESSDSTGQETVKRAAARPRAQVRSRTASPTDEEEKRKQKKKKTNPDSNPTPIIAMSVPCKTCCSRKSNYKSA